MASADPGSQDPLRSILVLVTAPPELYAHVAEPRRRGAAVQGLNYLETLRERGIRGTERFIERRVKEDGISAIFISFFGDGYHFPIGFLLRLRELAHLVVWAHDDEAYFGAHGKYYAQAAEAVVTTDVFSAYAYRGMGVPAVTHFTAISKDRFHPLPTERDIDVSFIGDCTKADRMEYLSFLKSHGLRVETAGVGSERGVVTFQEMNSLICRSKINLNFSRLSELSWINRDDPILNRVRQNKGRVIEVSMARGFSLSEYAPSLPLIFDVGKEVDCFWDKESLLGKVRYYLEHEAEREAMAERAHRKALERYEFGPYIGAIFAELRGILGKPEPAPGPTCFTGPRFQERRASVVFVHLLSLLARRRWGAFLEDLPELLRCGLRACVLGTGSGLGRLLASRVRRAFGAPAPAGGGAELL